VPVNPKLVGRGHLSFVKPGHDDPSFATRVISRRPG
jgi:hypothetical protein